MTASLDMIRGRSNIVTLLNNSGGALVAGDVCVQDTTTDNAVTTTTSAASLAKVFISAESIGIGATGRFYESAICPSVTLNTAATRGQFVFTHTVAKQGTPSSTYAAGAFGRVLTAGTTPQIILYSQTAQISGSGGNVTTTSATASPPSANSGDVWFPTDGISILRYSGSVEVPWGPIHPLTATKVSDFTWVNQGGATATNTGSGIALSAPISATNNCRILKVAAPSTPYTVTACFKSGAWRVINSSGFGLCFRQSSDGKLATFGLAANTGKIILAQTYTNETTFQATYQYENYYSNLEWFRIADDGANRICSISNDGQNWVAYHTIGRTDWLTANEVGVTFGMNNPTSQVDVLLASFKIVS